MCATTHMHPAGMQAFEGVLRDSQSQAWEPLAGSAPVPDSWISNGSQSQTMPTGSADHWDAPNSRFDSFSSEQEGGGGRGEAPSRSRQQQGWVNGGSSSGKPKPRSMFAIGHHGDRATHSPRIPLSGKTGREIGRVLGGGVVPGCLVLIGGDPGVGKSTIMLQIAAMIAHPEIDFDEVSNPGGSSSGGASQGLLSQNGHGVRSDGGGSAAGQEGRNGSGGGRQLDESRTVLYISGEENEEQVGLRTGDGGRLGQTRSRVVMIDILDPELPWAHCYDDLYLLLI